ncbi:MAG: ParB/RepB/Spo0J family partition protein [Lachnospiraceae bacterium]|uniref:ParB/RepB/Spo0J family partition protein n=1 Tax=uncultured Acetatifactor sp. TaxID=1671927 RepID=UPI002617A1D7|nr:ParB/RepB/Spo0J family partition protein [uncultured Acetatifactor sp.]MCI8790573.1 ParB/RepB/Spo0J family partition protein [Lachnospiraceae bacterium]
MAGKTTRGLGKGLDLLIRDAVGEAKAEKETAEGQSSSDKSDKSEQETSVKITLVEPNRKQPRKNFDEDSLQELSDSIKQVGLIQPILVQDRKDHYEIIAGERRWRAAKMAGLKEVPVIIRNYSEQEIMEISLIENIQREDLNPIEEAQAYKRLLEEFNLKQDEVAERVSKSRTAVTNSMRLLKLGEKVQQMVIDEMISTGHARALLAVEDQEEQYELAQKIFDEKLSVREVEKLVKNLHKPEKVQKKQENQTMQVIYQDIEDKLKQRLSTKVTVTSKGEGSGKIEIEFYNHEDLDRLLDIIGEKGRY